MAGQKPRALSLDKPPPGLGFPRAEQCSAFAVWGVLSPGHALRTAVTGGGSTVAPPVAPRPKWTQPGSVLTPWEGPHLPQEPQKALSSESCVHQSKRRSEWLFCFKIISFLFTFTDFSFRFVGKLRPGCVSWSETLELVLSGPLLISMLAFPVGCPRSTVGRSRARALLVRSPVCSGTVPSTHSWHTCVGWAAWALAHCPCMWGGPPRAACWPGQGISAATLSC